jgi:hypothetical protein
MYQGVKSVFADYWAAYGGARALFCSPYLHCALLLLVFTWHFWLAENWWEQSLSVLPNLLGFSLAGFAMFLGVGDEKFRSLLAEKNSDAEPSLYLALCSSFVHFILIQCLALAAAVIARSLYFPSPFGTRFATLIEYSSFPLRAFGYLLFLYALTSLLAATMSVFRICRIYEKVQLKENSEKSE